MKLPVIAVATALLPLLASCSTTKTWSATGGSRADATVRLSYEYSEFEKPKTDETEALNLAVLRCKTWGYTGAEAFGGVTNVCSLNTIVGCSRFIATKEFQCTGIGNKEPDPSR